MRSGKGTLARLVTEDNPTYTERAFADKLKQLVTLLVGVPLEWAYDEARKNEVLPLWGLTLGQMLQKIGTDLLRNQLDEDVWVKSTLADYTPILNLVVSDMRFPNECRAVRERGGILVKIIGDPSGQRSTSTRDLNHSSETSLDDWTDWDYIVNNNGTLGDLARHAGNILRLATQKTLGFWN